MKGQMVALGGGYDLEQSIELNFAEVDQGNLAGDSKFDVLSGVGLKRSEIFVTARRLLSAGWDVQLVFAQRQAAISLGVIIEFSVLDFLAVPKEFAPRLALAIGPDDGEMNVAPRS